MAPTVKHALEIYDNTFSENSFIKKTCLLTELMCQGEVLSSCERHTYSTIWSKNILSSLSLTIKILLVASKTKESCGDTGKAYYNVWYTPLLKQAVNTAVYKRAMYKTHG